ncbi:hypothetical protein C2E20_6362 [Micractinium conductrix]|uniref:Uncharacterized protein n=1 Tax=Micractinium conductrix TaxID=554055 RepID=A0A2P6V813_9CHLO|nr:hypothetical protein C2E20_6362 [Micractinium conductrix]|eukprot:PSC70218.1 hypothetical protein C2E20_6362 [Micractinium conductrix]
MAKRNSTSSGHRPPPRSVALTDVGPDLLALCLAHLPPPALLDLATTSRLFAAAVRLNVRGVAVGLRQRSPGSRGSAPAPAGLSPAVDRLALISPAAANAAGSAPAAAAQAAAWDPNESRLWQAGGPRLRPVTAAWHLRRALAARGAGAGAGGAVPAPRRQLALVLAAPEMDASDVELCRLLAAAGAEGTIDAVAVPQGLLRLAGGLNARLTAANVVAAGLPSALQASAPYTRLQRLTLKLSPDDDLPAILASVHPGTLPALRCLALLAGAPAGAAADLSALRHPALRRLDLRGVQLPAGFASLRHLTGEGSADGDQEEQAHPMAALEQRYIAALLARLPTLTSIQLTDYMGVVDPASLLPATTTPGTVAAAASQGKPAAAAAGPGAGKEALAAGSRAATPGLVLQQGGAAPGEGGAAAATGLGGGWRRTLAEAPVPGGISQFDVAYSFDP